jgi:ATP/maltotriose-dependent transcriptional regulator MalT
LLKRDSSLGVLSNNEIARELFVSATTAKAHLVPVCSKPGVEDRTAAVAAALALWGTA